MYSSRSASAAVPRERVGTIGEQLRHHLGRFEIALGIAREPAARRVERRVVMDAREHVEQRPIARLAKRTPLVAMTGTRKARQRRSSATLSDSSSRSRCRCSSTQTLVAAEEADETIEQAAHAVLLRIEHRPPGQRDEPGGEAVELLDRQRALPFRARASSCASRGDRDSGSPRRTRRAPAAASDVAGLRHQAAHAAAVPAAHGAA